MGKHHNTFHISAAPQLPNSEPPPEDDRVDDLPPATAMDSKYVQLAGSTIMSIIIKLICLSRKLNVKSVTVVRGSKGYGFAMRGVRGQCR